jgi:hypothetical protein
MSSQQQESSFETICKTVGAIVINWGMAERSLDYIVAILWHDFDGSSRAKRIPMMLDPKIAFARKCIEEDGRLAPLSRELSELLDEYSRLGRLRNDIVHSAVESTENVQDRILLSKLDVRDGLHRSRQVEITPESFPSIFSDMLTLSSKGLAFTERLLASSGN